MVNVVRLTPRRRPTTAPINPSTGNTNEQYQSALKAKGGPWQYYQLVMTQWPKLSRASRSLPGTPPNTFPGSGATTAFANVALETFDQANICTGCMNWPYQRADRRRTSCGRFTSMPGQVSITAPSAPPLFARGPSPDADAALTAPTLPAPLAALKELMESAATP